MSLDELAGPGICVGEHLQPPLATLLGIGLAAVAEVGLADDSQHLALARDNRDGADAMLHQQPSDVAYGRARPNRDHVLGHGFMRFHGVTSDTWNASQQTVSPRTVEP